MVENNTYAVNIISDAINELQFIIDKYISKLNFDDCIKVQPEDPAPAELLNSMYDQKLKAYLSIPKSIDSYLIYFGCDRPENKILGNKIFNLRNKFDRYLLENVTKDNFYLEFIVLDTLIAFWEDYLNITSTNGKTLKNKLKKAIPEPVDITKPIFKKEAVGQIFGILKGFFNDNQHVKLLNLLSTGDDSDELLIFIGPASRLLDAFRRLYAGDFITQCNRADFERWIERNFMFEKSKIQYKFKLGYIKDFITDGKSTENCISGIKELHLSTFT